jgi:hypothetical protein
MLKNALDACRAAGAKFAYFDNTYMYPQDARLQTEDTPFAPVGRKGRVRGDGVHGAGGNGARRNPRAHRSRARVLWAGQDAELHQRAGHRAAPGRPQAPRADARRHAAHAHLDTRRQPRAGGPGQRTRRLRADLAPALLRRPADHRQFVGMAAEVFGRKPAYTVIGPWTLAAAALFSSRVREIQELLPRYAHDNLFDSTRFKRRFPAFGVTTYREGLERIRQGWAGR